MSKSPLATESYPAYEGNFTYGRSGRKIEAITIHHMAGKLTARQCGAIFQTVGRCGSSHYGIGYNGEIACYVQEENTAWTNSNWDSNCKSVTIETSNDENGGNWHVSDASLNSLIKLVADIAKRNNLGKLIRGKNVTWHSMFANTSCPGTYLMSKMNYIIAEANKINGDKPATGFNVGDKVRVETCKPYKYYVADDVQKIYGIYQVREDLNAGGASLFSWRDNGIPEGCLDKVDANGNKTADSDRVHLKKGDKFVFAKTFTIKAKTVDFEKNYVKLSYTSNPDYDFWVVTDYLKKV